MNYSFDAIHRWLSAFAFSLGFYIFILCLLMSINYRSLVLAVLACAGAVLAAGTSISMALLSMKNEVNKEESANPASRSGNATDDHQVT